MIPPLRETAGRERASRGQIPAPPRSAATLARRRDGIDYDGLPVSLTEAAVEPGDVGYSRVRSTYLRGGAPGLVLQITSVPQVFGALAFARGQEGVALSLRSGGHVVSGRSTNDGGIVIDVSALNTIEILDQATRRVRLGPGARWLDVAAALAPHGWALTRLLSGASAAPVRALSRLSRPPPRAPACLTPGWGEFPADAAGCGELCPASPGEGTSPAPRA